MHNGENTDAVTMESVLQRENLQAAWRAVETNRGAAGVDGMGIQETKAHLVAHWKAIAGKLAGGEYHPAAIRAVEIPKPQGGTRTLGIPNVQDRLIQQAIHQKLFPLWEAEFSEHSYGFRPNRSAHDAIRAAQGYIQAGKAWVVDIDLKSFFDEVNHDRLMRLVGQKVRDKRLLRLIGGYLRAAMQTQDGRRQKRQKGTPQGGPLSPLLANIYLDALDKELEQRGVSFVLWEVSPLSGWIRRHIRKCFWLRWHTPRGRINALKRLGVKGRALGIGYTGLGAWRVARIWAMQQALSISTLKNYGFIIPWDSAGAHP